MFFISFHFCLFFFLNCCFILFSGLPSPPRFLPHLASRLLLAELLPSSDVSNGNKRRSTPSPASSSAIVQPGTKKTPPTPPQAPPPPPLHSSQNATTYSGPSSPFSYVCACASIHFNISTPPPREKEGAVPPPPQTGGEEAMYVRTLHSWRRAAPFLSSSSFCGSQ